MTRVEPTGKSYSVLLVAPWVRFMMYLVCLVPVAFAVWAVLRQALMPDGGFLLAVLVGLAVTVAFAWLIRRQGGR